jgi:hypothetical protein
MATRKQGGAAATKTQPEVSSAAFLKKVQPTKRKEAKTEQKWVMALSPDATDKVANHCRLAFIQNELKPVADQHKTAAIDALFDAWTEKFWSGKTVPENPTLQVKYPDSSAHKGMIDMQCMFVVAFVTEGIKLPKPEVLEEAGQTPSQWMVAQLTSEQVGLSQKAAEKFVNEEMTIQDRILLCMSITEMEQSENELLQSYAKKSLATMMGREHEPFTQEELQEAIMMQQVVILKDDLMPRLLSYCRNITELRKLINFIKAQKKFGPKLEFGIADSTGERVERMQTTIGEFLLDVEPDKDE